MYTIFNISIEVHYMNIRSILLSDHFTSIYWLNTQNTYMYHYLESSLYESIGLLYNKIAQTGWSNRNSFSHIIWGLEVRDLGSSIVGLWWDSVPGLQMPAFSFCLHMKERNRQRQRDEPSHQRESILVSLFLAVLGLCCGTWASLVVECNLSSWGMQA